MVDLVLTGEMTHISLLLLSPYHKVIREGLRAALHRVCTCVSVSVR